MRDLQPMSVLKFYLFLVIIITLSLLVHLPLIASRAQANLLLPTSQSNSTSQPANALHTIVIRYAPHALDATRDGEFTETIKYFL